MGIVIHKDSSGHNSLKRIGAIIGFLILSAGFIWMGWKSKLTWQMFLAYPSGAAVFYFPQLAITLLKIWTRQCAPQPSTPLPTRERPGEGAGPGNSGSLGDI